MGYFISITDADFAIPAAKLNRAYGAVCQLNNLNHLKRGNAWPRPEGLENTTTPTEHLWFSWMDWNYPETCKDLEAVLKQVGFHTYFDDKGNLVISGYSDKAGQEDVFLWTIAPYAIATLTDGPPYIDWQGEDGEHWRNVVIEKRLYAQGMAMVAHGEPRLFDPAPSMI